MGQPPDLAQRLEELESRVARLEGDTIAAAPHEAPSGEMAETFWALEGLLERAPEGGVLYTGAVNTVAGPVRWQYGLPSDSVLGADWSEAAPAISALASPVRLSILQAVLGGARSVSDLAASGEFGTSGQIYHHLGILTGAGWLSGTSRGRFEIPPARIVPLLAILVAAGVSP